MSTAPATAAPEAPDLRDDAAAPAGPGTDGTEGIGTGGTDGVGIGTVGSDDPDAVRRYTRRLRRDALTGLADRLADDWAVRLGVLP
ncbi:hypothetical protein [Streptomyces sp. NPDC090025]|uniref:hypothetical protein n=1 Tax=Streptomyces sp. NPDC090025 TaxID=3365922 RepID=UPI003836821B